MARLIARKQPGTPKRVVPDNSTRSQQRKEAARQPLLTYDEERDYCRRIQAGDHTAVQQLVERNLALAMDYAAKYMGGRAVVGALTYDDIYQNACIGLIEAATRYNGQHRFSTYATWWMRQSVNRNGEIEGDLIRIPAYLHTSVRRVNRAEGAGDPVTPDEVSQAATVPQQPLSLDTAVYVGQQDEVQLADIIADERADATSAIEERLDMLETLNWIRGHLTDLEWTIFSRRISMDQDMVLEVIGNGHKRETVRQIELRLSRKLRARGLCPDGAIRPHGPIARVARREIAEIAEKHSQAERRRVARGYQRRPQTAQTLHLSA